MLPIGSIIDLYVNKNKPYIPYGYLICDGSYINEDDYTELYYNLCEGTDDIVKLPIFEPISCGEYEIIKIIKALDDDNLEDVGNAEFIIKNE